MSQRSRGPANGQPEWDGPPCPAVASGRHEWVTPKYQRTEGGNKRRRRLVCVRCEAIGPRPYKRGARWMAMFEACQYRDGPGCFYCRGELDPETARLDHFVPSSAGGSNGLRNRRAACPTCDGRKGNQMPVEFDPERFGAPVRTPQKFVSYDAQTR